MYSRNFGAVSYKADVYSFGMLVMEMVGGRRNADPRIENQSEFYFPEWIYDQLVNGQDIGPAIEIANTSEIEIAKKLAVVALWCIQWDPRDRPSMMRVVQMLIGDSQNLPMPPTPFVSSPGQDAGAATLPLVHENGPLRCALHSASESSSAASGGTPAHSCGCPFACASGCPPRSHCEALNHEAHVCGSSFLSQHGHLLALLDGFSPPSILGAGPLKLSAILYSCISPIQTSLRRCTLSLYPPRFGRPTSEFRVGSFLPMTRAVFFPSWAVRESAVGRGSLRFQGYTFLFSNWVEMGERERGHLHHKVWIKLHDWPILCWNIEDVKAAVCDFGELWDVDIQSEQASIVSYFRLLERCQHVDVIPESIDLMVEDRCFSVPIEIDSVEEANPILLGESLDEQLDLGAPTGGRRAPTGGRRQASTCDFRRKTWRWRPINGLSPNPSTSNSNGCNPTLPYIPSDMTRPALVSGPAESRDDESRDILSAPLAPTGPVPNKAAFVPTSLNLPDGDPVDPRLDPIGSRPLSTVADLIGPSSDPVGPRLDPIGSRPNSTDADPIGPSSDTSLFGTLLNSAQPTPIAPQNEPRPNASSTSPIPLLGAPTAPLGHVSPPHCVSPPTASPPNSVIASGGFDARHLCRATASGNPSIFRRKSSGSKVQEDKSHDSHLEAASPTTDCTTFRGSSRGRFGTSGSFVETDKISGSFAGQTNATPPMSDLASSQNRDTTHPLTPDEIQLIKTVCGISDIDVGAAPICQNAPARIIGANYTGV
uniref:Protein kinase domain-containing protein n=1 Tax=Ananas comosus var. bracteatus TaxID=296719 RepID=A0A6V7Q5X8_ANACO|nr:unnamed protein product [Ananas comosus var. bracteatus]